MGACSDRLVLQNMAMWLRKGIIPFLFFFSFILAMSATEEPETSTSNSVYKCQESSCGIDGPPIRFPFRLKGRQPEWCGHNSLFDLYCSNDTNQTVMELPFSQSVKAFIINSIDYASQLINVSYPDDEACLHKQNIANFNVSSSPFMVHDGLYQYVLFNCSETYAANIHLQTLGHFPCLNVSGYVVFAANSSERIIDNHYVSCTRVHRGLVSLPASLFDNNIYTTLSWSQPDCRYCEEKGGQCIKQEKSKDSECIGMYDDSGTSEGGLQMPVMMVFAGVVAYSLFVAATNFLYVASLKRKFDRKIKKFLEDYKALKPARFSYADIKRITNQFKEELGQGSYGTVFKGKLHNEIEVAVKVLNTLTRNGQEFINEMETMCQIHHVNVARLVGFCADGFERALVYECLPNGSLQKFISSADTKDVFLGWEKLQDIALGIAKGIEYLHHGCEKRILHFDIKPQNILLDHNFTPKISDFGLAKLCSKDQTIVSMTTARGTLGYISPEVFSRNFGNVSFKSDVYSYGMLLLEMVGGRKITDTTVENSSKVYYPEWIYKLVEHNEDIKIHIEGEEDTKIAKKLSVVGLWCIQWHPANRPTMKDVIQMLEGNGDKLVMPPNPFASTSTAKTRASIGSVRLNQELSVIRETE